MRTFTRLGRILKKIKTPLSVIAMVVTIVIGIFVIYDKTQSYIISKKESRGSKSISKIIQINKGETKLIFEDGLLQITIDNILIIDGTNLYRVSGKINDGILTSPFDNTQGESFQFVRFIIQINRIASDYAEFRVSFTNNY